jgi:hypothetical protein
LARHDLTVVMVLVVCRPRSWRRRDGYWCATPASMYWWCCAVLCCDHYFVLDAGWTVPWTQPRHQLLCLFLCCNHCERIHSPLTMSLTLF